MKIHLVFFSALVAAVCAGTAHAAMQDPPASVPAPPAASANPDPAVAVPAEPTPEEPEYVSIPTNVEPVPGITADDRILGRPDAPITVVEYSSFVCIHCAGWHTQILPEFKARFIDTGEVKLVFRDLPTEPVQVAAIAAGVARCAVPDRFFEVADTLMTGQAKLKEDGLVMPWLEAAIAVSGKTRPEIETCLSDPTTLASIQASRQGGTAAGVIGTPTFFVEGVRVGDYSIDGLAEEIARRKALR